MARQCPTPSGFQVPQGLNFNGGRTILLSPPWNETQQPRGPAPQAVRPNSQ